MHGLNIACFIRKFWDICGISYDVYLWYLVMYVCIVYILWCIHHNILSQRRKIINVMTQNIFIGTTNYIQMHISLSIYISIWIRGLVCHHFWLEKDYEYIYFHNQSTSKAFRASVSHWCLWKSIFACDSFNGDKHLRFISRWPGGACISMEMLKSYTPIILYYIYLTSSYDNDFKFDIA